MIAGLLIGPFLNEENPYLARLSNFTRMPFALVSKVGWSSDQSAAVSRSGAPSNA